MIVSGKSKYFGGNPGGPGTGRNPEGERVRRLCRAKTEKAVRALVEALEAQKPVVVANGGSEGSRVEYVPDHDVRIKAAQYLLDRGYGKPLTEVAERDGNQIPLVPGTPEYDEMLRREWGFDRTGRGVTNEPGPEGSPPRN